ncbi:MAG: hypothetical protein IPJ20_22040 [Flammeovirgaceae bacterium]|nr:hypothetical protein [Flammeovirgaceae bacterium]
MTAFRKMMTGVSGIKESNKSFGFSIAFNTHDLSRDQCRYQANNSFLVDFIFQSGLAYHESLKTGLQ